MDENKSKKNALHSVRGILVKHIIILTVLTPIFTFLLTLENKSHEEGGLQSTRIDASILPLYPELFGLLILVALTSSFLLSPWLLKTLEKGANPYLLGLITVTILWSVPMLLMVPINWTPEVGNFVLVQITMALVIPALIGLSLGKPLKRRCFIF